MKAPNVWQVCHHCRGEWACGWCSGGDAIECSDCAMQPDTRGMGDLELNALAREYEARGVRCEECAKAEFVTADTLPPFGSDLSDPPVAFFDHESSGRVFHDEEDKAAE